jgi:hypothetical protein
MNLEQRLKLQLVVLILLIFVNARLSDAETSGEYLQKVMIELQELNVPSSSATLQDRLSNRNYQHANYQADHSQDNIYPKFGISSAQQDTKYEDIQKRIASVPNGDKIHPATNIVQYYAVCKA